MKNWNILLCTLLLFLTHLVFAQEAQRQTFELNEEQLQQDEWWTIPLQADPFLAFSASWESSEAHHIYYRFRDANKLGFWHLLKTDDHFVSNDDRKVSQLIFAPKTWTNIQVRIEESIGGSIPSKVKLHFYSPGSATITANTDWNTNIGTQTCPCPQPSFLNRNAWCPNGDCPEHPSPEFTDVTHLIVHHAASTNVSSNWSGVVRSIWDYHVNTNGWSDIGYKWLIDPDGVVYEGRGDNILGAHFCGNNTGTVGICMLGDFTNTTPAKVALDQLEKMLSWKACDADLDPLGSGFHASSNQNLSLISGHRDGCNTACPGDQFYPLFPALRMGVQNYLEMECAEFLPPTNLAAWATSTSTIQLSWEDNTNSETVFLLERSKNNTSQYTTIAQLPANSEGFTDTNLAAQTAYFYRVRAATSTDTTAYSNEYGVATILTSNTELSQTSNIEIFPNPISGPFRLSIANAYRGSMELELYDLAMGRLVKNWNVEKNTLEWQSTLDLHNLSSGVFMLQVKMGAEVHYLKVICP